MRESMEFDVVIVGGGPAGLSAACQLAKRAQNADQPLTICVVEKGSEIGAHILSGAVIETRALDELFSDWKERGAPVTQPVTVDETWMLKSEQDGRLLPSALVPNTLHNNGNYVISLGQLCRWLAEQAESLGVEVFPGFAATEPLIEDGIVRGVITGDMGREADGSEGPNFMPGMELRARYTLFAEGCRGHLGKVLEQRFNLAKNADPQHYGLGIKELWQVKPEQHQPGKVVHGFGWPLGKEAGGGFFLYHLEGGQVVVGLITDLNYANPWLSPYEEFQRLKHHPVIAKTLEGGERVSYGARAIAKGGFNAMPEQVFAGGMLIGCDAGTLNVSKIKGTHTAMKSGMIAADAVADALLNGDEGGAVLTEYHRLFKASWLYEELYGSRNFGPALHRFGPMLGGAFNWINSNLLGHRWPFTIHDTQADHEQLQPASECLKIEYAKPDGILSFDRLSSVFISNTNHEENQPCHLQLKNEAVVQTLNIPVFEEPAQRYCPAGVYELVETEGRRSLQINAQNCLHCKTCDIKDPGQNINWVPPEGAGGPNYPNM